MPSASGAAPLFGAGALKNKNAELVMLEFTTSSEAVTSVKGQNGFTVGDFSTGVATLSFPPVYDSVCGIGVVNTDNATASSRQELLVNNVDEAAGTATLRVVDSGSGATEAIGDGTYHVVLFCGGL